MDVNASTKASKTANLSIVNIVVTADLKQRVDLRSVAKLKYVIYDFEIYRGLAAYLKTPDMDGKVSVFSSGKLISVGTRKYDQARKDLQHTADVLSENGLIDPIQVTPRMRNIVATLVLPRTIDLELLSHLPVIYEPEQFPGAILKLAEPKATVLIFASGKMVITGVSTQKQLAVVAEKVNQLICSLD